MLKKIGFLSVALVSSISYCHNGIWKGEAKLLAEKKAQYNKNKNTQLTAQERKERARKIPEQALLYAKKHNALNLYSETKKNNLNEFSSVGAAEYDQNVPWINYGPRRN